MMLVEKSEGILERCLTSGVTQFEFLTTYLLAKAIVMMVQVFETIFVCLYVFDFTNKGSLTTVVALLGLVGLCGLTYGLLISCWCHTERTALLMLMGSNIPCFYLSGLLWPMEGMHWTLRKASYILPTTQPLYTLRAILQKGASLGDVQVFSGFAVLIVIISVNIIGCVIALRFSRK
jgi:ABC-type multidrug transport system permease subunit